MLAKLAFRNVRRSVRDYAIYFVTLVFGVAVFYAFNSVTGQSILFDLEDTATASVFEMTGQMLGMFSVVIACGHSRARVAALWWNSAAPTPNREGSPPTSLSDTSRASR